MHFCTLPGDSLAPGKFTGSKRVERDHRSNPNPEGIGGKVLLFIKVEFLGKLPHRTRLAADQALDLRRGSTSYALRCATPLFQTLQARLRMPSHPLVARFARDSKLPAKLCHREMTASCQTDKSMFLFHW